MNAEPELIDAETVAELLPETVGKSLTARLCGISRPTLDRILTGGRPALDDAGRIALVDVEQLRGGRRVTLVDYLRAQHALDQASAPRDRGTDLRAAHALARAEKANRERERNPERQPKAKVSAPWVAR